MLMISGCGAFQLTVERVGGEKVDTGELLEL